MDQIKYYFFKYPDGKLYNLFRRNYLVAQTLGFLYVLLITWFRRRLGYIH